MAPSTGVTGCCPGGCSGATQPSGAVLLHGPKYPQDSGTGVTSSWLGVPRQEAGPNPTPGAVFLAPSPPHLQTPGSCPGNTRTSAKPQQDGDGGRTGGSGPAAQRGCGGRGAGGRGAGIAQGSFPAQPPPGPAVPNALPAGCPGLAACPPRGRDLGFPSAARKEASAAAHGAASHTQVLF